MALGERCNGVHTNLGRVQKLSRVYFLHGRPGRSPLWRSKGETTIAGCWELLCRCVRVCRLFRLRNGVLQAVMTRWTSSTLTRPCHSSSTGSKVEILPNHLTSPSLLPHSTLVCRCVPAVQHTEERSNIPTV